MHQNLQFQRPPLSFVGRIQDFHGLDELVNFERACEKRHNDIGRPLAALSQEYIMRGYMTVVDKQVVPNLWEPGTGGGEQPTVDLSYADAVQIKNQFDPWTSIITTKNGRVSTIEDIGEEFGPEARLPRKEKKCGIPPRRVPSRQPVMMLHRSRRYQKAAY